MPLTVISYNILADSYIRPSHYPGVPAPVLAAEHRLPLLVRRMREHAADVMCLQEVEPHAFDLIKTELASLGYASHFAQKRSKPEGCATLVRQEAPTIGMHTLYFRDNRGNEKESGHVALLLIVRGPYGKIGIANTHFKWDPPGTPLAEQRGLRQASELLAYLGSVESPDTPWIVCGDFNVVSDSSLVTLFKNTGFVDAYREREKMYTCAPNGQAKRIDYIFHSGSLSSRPMDLPAITDNTSLPSAREPSDHVAIGASLVPRGS
jgi:mRNA deadenylase 3'-5' endonuclease subunit Ccr4